MTLVIGVVGVAAAACNDREMAAGSSAKRTAFFEFTVFTLMLFWIKSIPLARSITVLGITAMTRI